MNEPQGASAALTIRERARQLILADLGVRRVAAWCGVGEATVYQWLHRGNEAEPVPAARVAAIVHGAAREGLACPITILAPRMAAAIVGAR